MQESRLLLDMFLLRNYLKNNVLLDSIFMLHFVVFVEDTNKFAQDSNVFAAKMVEI